MGYDLNGINEVIYANFKYKLSSLIYQICDFDKIISKYYTSDKFSDYVIDSSENMPLISDKELVESSFHFSSSKKLYVIFGPWSSENKLISGLRNKIVSRGYSCLQLEFPKGFLCSDPERTSIYFNKISKIIREKISVLVEKYSFYEINLLGISLGVSLMAMVANNNKTFFNKIIFLGGSAGCGDTVFEGVATRKLKEEYERRGESCKSLNKKYFEMDPLNLLNLPKDTEIIMHIGKYDTVSPYKLGKKLVKKMRGMGFKPNVHVYSQGHYFTILNYLENPFDISEEIIL